MLKKKKTENTESPENLTGIMHENNQNGEAHEADNNQPATPAAEDKLKEELSAANDKYLRLFAEFDNFRRRTAKEREEARKMEGRDVIVALLPVLDDFDRALRSMDSASDIIAVRQGVDLVKNKLSNLLFQKGLREMESIGSAFDPDLHEAITNIPAPTDEWKGKVVDEMEKGYYLNDKVVRFAKVIVGS